MIEQNQPGLCNEPLGVQLYPTIHTQKCLLLIRIYHIYHYTTSTPPLTCRVYTHIHTYKYTHILTCTGDDRVVLRPVERAGLTHFRRVSDSLFFVDVRGGGQNYALGMCACVRVRVCHRNVGR